MGREVRKGNRKELISRRTEQGDKQNHLFHTCQLKRTGKVAAVEVKNAFQGIATAQKTVLMLFEEMMRDFKAKIGIDRVASTYKQYEVLHKQLKDFLKVQYHVKRHIVWELDLPFIEALEFYFRVKRKMKAATIKARLILFNKIVLSALHHPFTVHRF